MKRTTGRGRRTAGPFTALAALTAFTSLAACTAPGSPDVPAPEGTRTPRASAPGTPGGPLDALRTAERATRLAASARVRSETVMGTRLSVTGEGTVGWGDGPTAALTVTYTGGTVADTMRSLGVTSMEARYLDDAYYARMSDAFAARTGGRHWVRYAYDDLAALGGAGDFADQMRSTMPDRSVRLLLDSDDVRRVGTEAVDGQTTVHFTGSVRVEDVSDADLREQLTRAGVTVETVDLWINEEHLLVKKTERTGSGAERITQTAHYRDYGVRVTVHRPPAEDTADFTSLMGTHGSGRPGEGF